MKPYNTFHAKIVGCYSHPCEKIMNIMGGGYAQICLVACKTAQSVGLKSVDFFLFSQKTKHYLPIELILKIFAEVSQF